MANRQLVMLNCKTSHKTPLVRVKPDFTYISVTGLGQGDQVWLKIKKNSYTDFSLSLESGLNPFPIELRDEQFQIEKIAGPNSGPTTIEVLRGV